VSPHEDDTRRRFGLPRGGPDVTWSDDRLVSACLAGNEQAWSALIDKYKNLIYSIPLKYGATPEDAADVFQSVCVDLLTELPRIRESAALRGWLMTVTANRMFHLKRKQQRRGEQELTPFDQDERAALDALPPAVIEEIEREQMVREAVASLAPRCREMIRLLFYEDPPVPYRDLAQRLGLATGSIGFIRGRCLRRLERALTKAGFA
jgi:RNA polymerase sigma factor (sigma-70 family)